MSTTCIEKANTQKGTTIIQALCFFTGLDTETRKHCCQVGTNYSSNGFDCKTFLPEMVGNPELTGSQTCLSMVDVCCKKRYR